MKKKLAPSMMCVDYRTLPQTLALFEENGVEYLHIDIMDGVFVKNYTLGTDFCRVMREMTSIPLDIHLMITEPEWKIDWFKPQPGEYVSVHAESTDHLQRALAAVKSCGAKAMAALNPATPLYVLDYVLDDIDGVLVVPREIAYEVLLRAEEIKQNEKQIFSWVHNGDSIESIKERGGYF